MKTGNKLYTTGEWLIEAYAETFMTIYHKISSIKINKALNYAETTIYLLKSSFLSFQSSRIHADHMVGQPHTSLLPFISRFFPTEFTGKWLVSKDLPAS